MVAAFQDAPVLDEDDLIGVPQRSEAMGDDEGRAVRRMFLERFANTLFGTGVDGGHGIVEHQDRRPQQRGPGDGHPLLLPAGQRHPALPHQGLVLFRQLVDEPVDLGGGGGVLDGGVIGPRIAVGDVVLKRGREQERILLNHAHGPAQGLEGDVANVLAVHRDPAAADIVVAGKKMGDGGLAAARWADDPEGLAPFHPERYPAQDRRRPLTRIGKGYVLKLKDAVGGLQRPGVVAVSNGRLQIQHREQPRATSGRPGEGVHHHAELTHGLLEDGHEGEKLGQRAHGHVAVDHAQSPDPQHQPHGHEEREVHGGGGGNPRADAPGRQRQGVIRGNLVLGELVELRAERPHHPDAGEVFIHDPAQHRHPLLQDEPHLPQPEPDRGGTPRHKRHEAEAQTSEEHVRGHQQVGAHPDEDGEQQHP